MAKFLTTHGTSYQIENIIKNAESKLVLVSPYLQLSNTFFERLKDADRQHVEIKIIYGKDDLKPNERNSLAELSRLELFYFENLHAKCYFNESEMVITSMNMYEFSQKNNREMGVFIKKLEDSQLFNDAVKETQSIIQSSELISLAKTTRRFYADENRETGANGASTPKRGYCIRCEERIAYSIDKPYCYDCFMVWSQFENPHYQESVCHGCGEFENTSMEKPVCYGCYQKYEKE